MKKIPPSKYLIILSSAFFLGVFVSELIYFQRPILLFGIIILLILALFFYYDQKIILLVLAGISFFAGIFYYQGFSQINRDNLNQFYNQEVILQGQISANPDIRANHIKLSVQVYQIKLKGEEDFSQAAQGKILVTQDRYPEPQFGDWLEVNGTLKEPQKYPDFDYKNYLSRYGISSIINYGEVEQIDKPNNIQQSYILKNWLKLKKQLFIIKNSFENKINQILPEPQSSFLAGLVLGSKRAIPNNLMEAFNRTGTTHIVVISGYNITIIISAIMTLTRRRYRKIAMIFSIIGIFLFTIMVGAEAPVVRAALMALLVIWATKVGRKSEALIGLILTALVMILINPKILRFDLGFQFSFLAVAGLIWFSPIFEDLLARWQYKKYLPKIISEPLIATLSAQVLVVPVILYQFHRLSFISPVANVLVLSVIPLAMFFGFFSGLLGFLWLGLGKLMGYLACLFLTYMIKVVFWLGSLPLASFETSQISWVWLLAWYIVMIIFIFWYYKNRLKEKIV